VETITNDDRATCSVLWTFGKQSNSLHMLTVDHFKPELHTFVEGDKAAHQRVVLNDFVVPALLLIANDLQAEGRSLGGARTIIDPTLTVDFSVSCKDGTTISARVQLASENYLEVFLTGVGELYWAQARGGVEYAPGAHHCLVRAFDDALKAFLRKVNDPGMYYHGNSGRLYA